MMLLNFLIYQYIKGEPRVQLFQMKRRHLLKQGTNSKSWFRVKTKNKKQPTPLSFSISIKFCRPPPLKSDTNNDEIPIKFSPSPTETDVRT